MIYLAEKATFVNRSAWHFLSKISNAIFQLRLYSVRYILSNSEFDLKYYRCDTIPMTAIGDFLKNARKEKGLSQSDLADLSGVTQGAISAIETGKRSSPQWDTIKNLFDALDVQADVLPELTSADDIIDASLVEKSVYTAEIKNYEDAIRDIVAALDDEKKRAVWLFASGVFTESIPRIIGAGGSKSSERRASLSDTE